MKGNIRQLYQLVYVKSIIACIKWIISNFEHLNL